MYIRYIFLLSLILFSVNTYAVQGDSDLQENDSSAILADIDSEKDIAQLLHDEDLSFSKADYRKVQETHRFYLIAAMIAVTPVFLLILLSFIRKSKDFNEHAILHSSGLVLVIQATVIVVIASPTTEQLTAAIGVLAAIAGYLFGSARRSKSEIQ